MEGIFANCDNLRIDNRIMKLLILTIFVLFSSVLCYSQKVFYYDKQFVIRVQGDSAQVFEFPYYETLEIADKKIKVKRDGFIIRVGKKDLYIWYNKKWNKPNASG